jgi:hypothetical protein
MRALSVSATHLIVRYYHRLCVCGIELGFGLMGKLPSLLTKSKSNSFGATLYAAIVSSILAR